MNRQVHKSHHRPAPTTHHKSQTASAYSALATELKTSDVKTVGGYSLGRVIGQGAWGKVRLGVHRLTGTRVAIKQLPKSTTQQIDAGSPLALLVREIHHHRRLRHPHILALYEIIATETSIYLVTELCTGGELFDYLVEKGRLSTTETRRIFGQLVLGVAHLHSSGVVHRDLKLENILLDERVNVKIADLGFGREFEQGRWMETWVGTLGYCAPEVVAAKRYLGEKVDIWSLGVILYTLLTGSLPFDDDDEDVMKAKILRCEYDIPTWLSEDATSLIRSILVLDPLQRPSLKSILAHAFFVAAWPPSDPAPRGRPRPASPHPPMIPEDGGLEDEDSHNEEAGKAADAGLGARRCEDSTIDRSGSGSARAGEPFTATAKPSSNHHEDQVVQQDLSSASSSPLTSTVPPLAALVAPRLQRNISASSSIHSNGSVGGSPNPAHSRTPSRTKRRSFGSAYSERLFSLDEENEEPPVDYLALLSTVHAPALASKEDRALLDSLTSLGFDTGQIVHSVTTDACDASAAMYWMLARKRDERRRASQRSGGESDLSRKSSLGKGAGDDVEQASNEAQRNSEDAGRAIEDDNAAPRIVAAVTPATTVVTLPGTPAVISGPSTSTAEERLDYFLTQRPLSTSTAPMHEYFPIVEPGSPSKAARAVGTSTALPSASDSPNSRVTPRSPEAAGRLSHGSPPESPRRNRTGSVGMLARATSVLGGGLASKRDDERGPGANLFTRRSSDQGQETAARSSDAPVMVHSTSQETFDTVTTVATTKRRHKRKGQGRAGFLANFKMWFVDERRRGNSASNVKSSASVGSGLGRSQSLQHRPAVKPGLHSRRSSSASVQPLSRHSSVNSRAPSRPQDLATSPTLRRRRPSDASYSGHSDIGPPSRPASVRSRSGNDVRRWVPDHRPPSMRPVPTTTTVRSIRPRGQGSRARSSARYSSSSSVAEVDSDHAAWTPPRKSGSSTSLTSHHDRPHTPVLFTAHKVSHLFGAPQPRRRPARDVFRDEEWEDLDGYGGGLGQVPGDTPDPVVPRAFESRYAGVPGARQKFTGAALIVEEEEEPGED